MLVNIEKTVTAAPNCDHISQRVLETAAMFGLGVDELRTLSIVPRIEVPLRCGQIVFITGPSGSGKTTMLRLIEAACRERGVAMIDAGARVNAAIGAGDADCCSTWQSQDLPVIDCLGETIEHAMALLSLVGLGDAFVMLRRPRELSDGQQARFRLAKALEAAQRQQGPTNDGSPSCVILADEFGATLDRITAQTIARSIRRWIRKTGFCFVAATTHDDLLEPLEPDVLVWKGLGEQAEVVTR